MTDQKTKIEEPIINNDYIADLNTLPKTTGKMQTVFKVLEIGSTIVGFANFKASIIIFTIGFIGKKIFEKKDLETEFMPDDWLAKVADNDEVSLKGLSFLKAELEKTGKISVSIAQQFIDIENKEVELKLKATEKAANLKKAGAKSILEKGKTSFKDNLNLDSLETISNAVKTLKTVKNSIPTPVLELGLELIQKWNKRK